MGCGASSQPSEPAAVLSHHHSMVTMAGNPASTLAEALAQNESEDIPLGLAEVTIVSGHGLAAADLFTKNDGYVVIGLGSKIRRTPSVHQCDEPVWNQAARFFVNPAIQSYVLTIKVYDHDHASADDLLGSAEIPIKLLANGKEGAPQAIDLQLTDGHGRLAGRVKCAVRMLPRQLVKQIFWKAFSQVVDTNGNGYISVAELSDFMGFLGNPRSGDEREKCCPPVTCAHMLSAQTP